MDVSDFENEVNLAQQSLPQAPLPPSQSQQAHPARKPISSQAQHPGVPKPHPQPAFNQQFYPAVHQPFYAQGPY